MLLARTEPGKGRINGCSLTSLTGAGKVKTVNIGKTRQTNFIGKNVGITLR